jgi:hypothetical protein
MLRDQADEIAQEGFTSPLGQLMLHGQRGRKMLEGDGATVLGRST